MRPLWLLALLGGCHDLFNLELVEIGDGSGGDPDRPIDPQCPAIGDGPPVFRTEPRIAIGRLCLDYTTSHAANLATAVCNDGTSPVVEQGPIDSALAPAQVVVEPGDETIVEAWLAPEGDVLVARQRVYPENPSVHRIATYELDGATWRFRNQIAAQSTFVTAGVPSAGPERRVLVNQVSPPLIRELVERAGAWEEVRQIPWTDLLPNGSGGSTHLSSDGLRMTFEAFLKVHYAVRPSVDAPFNVPVAIAGIDAPRDPFIAENCERIYYVAGGTVQFRYLQQ
jgi:hypothetical protein